MYYDCIANCNTHQNYAALKYIKKIHDHNYHDIIIVGFPLKCS